VGLTGRESQQLGTFSKGMLQRIGLAQALLNQPELLILDELVAGLDPVGQRDMRELLFELKSQGTTIFLNSHQLADVEALCDRIAIINQGRILKVGTPAELFGDEHLFEVRVDQVNDELLHQLSTIALSVTRDSNDPGRLLLALEQDEQAADIAAIIHAQGARLYTLAPHRRSLEQLFFHVIDALQQTQ
jgi:ABC-2 type transport system ATP-binding protein